MDLGFDKKRLLQYKAAAVAHLSDPMKLRLLVTFGLVLAVLVVAYMPLMDRIQKNRVALAEKKRRLEVIGDVEKLRAEVDTYRDRIAKGADTNEWVQYILGGLRKTRVKLRDMASHPPKKVGPYQTVNLEVEVQGTYAEVKSFMEWLEQSDRLVRVDTVRLEKQAGTLVMRIVVQGLAHKNAKPA